MGTMSIVVTAGAQPGELLVRDGPRITRMFAVVDSDVTWVFHNGEVFLVADESARPAKARHAHGSLNAPMPATVVSVNVAPGDQVEAGQTLIVLEAMKMELPLRAPGSGRIKAINCRPGEFVLPDVDLIELE
jgi:biotin carboxyl carrier protein